MDPQQPPPNLPPSVNPTPASNPTLSKSKPKWPIILIIIIVGLVLFGSLIPFLFGGLAFLALRNQGSNLQLPSSPPSATNQPQATLHPGFRSDIPIYPDAKLLGSGPIHIGDNSFTSSWEIDNEKVPDAINFYTTKMGENGWQATDPESNVVKSADIALLSYEKSNGKNLVTVQITKGNNKGDIQINLFNKP